MALSIAITKDGRKVDVYLGDWTTHKQAKVFVKEFESHERLIALKGFHNDEGHNEGVLQAMVADTSNEYSIGRDIEYLIKFVFQLGRGYERATARAKRRSAT